MNVKQLHFESVSHLIDYRGKKDLYDQIMDLLISKSFLGEKRKDGLKTCDCRSLVQILARLVTFSKDFFYEIAKPKVYETSYL